MPGEIAYFELSKLYETLFDMCEKSRNIVPDPARNLRRATEGNLRHLC
jgi:hypothetical protein